MSGYDDPKLDEFEARIKAASTEEEKIAISKEAMQYLTDTGQSIDVERLEATITFTVHTVTTILDAILATADQMGANMVPVDFIRDLRSQVGPLISQKMFEATDLLGVPLNYGDVPDDISGLMG